MGYFLVQVCEAVGNFIAEFCDADENNFKVSRPLYLRVRALINITKPLKRRMHLEINDNAHVVVQF